MTKKQATANNKKKRTAVKKKASQPTQPVDALSPNRQQALFRAVEKVLRDAGVSSPLDGLLFDTQTGPLMCPPGTARRMICRKDPNGVVRCVPQCVPIPGP